MRGIKPNCPLTRTGTKNNSFFAQFIFKWRSLGNPLPGPHKKKRKSGPFGFHAPRIILSVHFRDYYLTSAGWIGQKNTQVSVVWINRAQNLSIVSACLAPNWTCIEVSMCGPAFAKQFVRFVTCANFRGGLFAFGSELQPAVG